MTDDTPISILDAFKYTEIATNKGAITALTKFAEDIGAQPPKIDQQSSGKFMAYIPGVEIGGDGSTRSFISNSGPTEQAAAAALLKTLLNPKTASGEGEPYLSVAGTRYKVAPLAVLAA